MAQKRKLTPAIAGNIKWYRQNTDLFNDQIAAKVDQNPGRVSEVLSGKRFSDVPPSAPA